MCKAFYLRRVNSSSQLDTVVVPILLMNTRKLGEARSLCEVVWFEVEGPG